MPGSQQRTLRTKAAVRGRGLHTGEECGITLLPAEPDTGVVFAAERGEIKAAVQNIVGTHRGTVLRSGDAEIRTAEHLLAALAGLGVDNARIETDGPEIPAVDGSALPFVELIESAGITEQAADARTVGLTEPVWVADAGKYLLAVPGTGLRASALISFQNPMIGEQAISLQVDPETFKREIAPARTFCTADEIEMILAQGLGKGGDKNNVIVVHDDCYSTSLRFEDEFVRHKMLDLIGDLSLIGGRLRAGVTAIKTSHALNVALVDKIVKRAACKRQGG